jgi:hypothetical protein
MATGALGLALPALRLEPGIELIKARRLGDRHHEVQPRVLHQPLDVALVVPLARTPEAIGEQIMADQFGERPGPLALAVAADLGHRDRGVVIQKRQRHPAEERERRHMAVEERFGRLARIRLHKARVRLRQVHAEEVDLLPHAADHRDRFAKINLAMARRMRQRHERLAAARPADTDIILHHRIAAGEVMLVAQPLEDPLCRMPLLHWSRPVSVQDRVDHRQQRAQLGLRHRRRPRVARR